MKKSIKSKKFIRKTIRKPAKRQKKPHFSDAVRAFMLVGVIVALSALISCAVIMVHSSIQADDSQQASSGQLSSGELTSGETIKKETPIAVTIEPPAPEPKKPEPPAAAAPITPPAETRPSSAPATPVASATPVATNVSAVITPRPPVANLGNLVFVIDDAGNNLKDLEPFLQVPGPLTIAVLPGLPNSAETARRIRAAGKEVILHQPMEAIGGQDPGPGAIYSNMSSAEIRAVLAKNLAEVGPVTGMNNHQGSRITMDREAMQTILEFCAENKIYFLDSRTTADSIVPALARQMGIKIAERNIFIDNEQNKESMLRYITGGLTRAQRNGTAVLIGHTWSPDLAPLLTEQFPLFIEQGYTIKKALDIIR